MWLNPRIFPPPASTNNWAAKAVLGERVWLNRDKIPVPEHYHCVPSILSIVSTTGMVFVRSCHWIFSDLVRIFTGLTQESFEQTDA
ncbi:hypothetical protein P0S91_22390 [Gloeocapsopsis dulcis]|nr:hypothetical protein P0S91_22390 [Gloeocapsopsis dulcis]